MRYVEDELSRHIGQQLVRGGGQTENKVADEAGSPCGAAFSARELAPDASLSERNVKFEFRASSASSTRLLRLSKARYAWELRAFGHKEVPFMLAVDATAQWRCGVQKLRCNAQHMFCVCAVLGLPCTVAAAPTSGHD